MARLLRMDIREPALNPAKSFGFSEALVSRIDFVGMHTRTTQNAINRKSATNRKSYSSRSVRESWFLAQFSMHRQCWWWFVVNNVRNGSSGIPSCLRLLTAGHDLRYLFVLTTHDEDEAVDKEWAHRYGTVLCDETTMASNDGVRSRNVCFTWPDQN